MYILIVSRGYPSKEYKMNGIFEFDQAKALVSAGHKVIYIAIDLRSIRRKRNWGYESFIKEGVQIEAINIPCGRIPKSFLNSIRIFAFKKLFKKIVSKYGKPELIHAHFINYGYVISRVFSKKSNEIPLIISEHYSAMNKEVIDEYLTKLGNFTYPRMNKVIAVSEYLAKGIQKKFGVETAVIPNIVDTSNFIYTTSIKNGKDFNFISTGRLVYGKRMDLLITSFYKAFCGNKSVNLYIYGDGPEYFRLSQLIQTYGIEGQVHLMGLVERNEIANKMKESDCFVLSSQLETFGVAYIEALAMGLPVIATKCGGPEGFIHEKNGKLVSVDDGEALSKAMLDVFNNIEIYNKKEIAEETKKRFSPEQISNELFSIYNNVVKGQKNE
ncbi:glycosyltransferase [Mesobacillus subterraneus]|uniref:glycosyltransferase n=1 Tax=Mesobacillus subterraneus TaxID=285983 RepID=UPI001CFF29C5|nr:glycosyltransferase [Mesobacillus subterraneus]